MSASQTDKVFSDIEVLDDGTIQRMLKDLTEHRQCPCCNSSPRLTQMISFLRTDDNRLVAACQDMQTYAKSTDRTCAKEDEIRRLLEAQLESNDAARTKARNSLAVLLGKPVDHLPKELVKQAAAVWKKILAGGNIPPVTAESVAPRPPTRGPKHHPLTGVIRIENEGVH